MKSRRVVLLRMELAAASTLAAFIEELDTADGARPRQVGISPEHTCMEWHGSCW